MLFSYQIKELLGRFFPKMVAKIVYRRKLGRKLNLDSPVDFNEKISYLSLCTDTSAWTPLADKYLVREYVEKKGLAHLLIPLLGVWDDPGNIDFSKLTPPYVLKTNSGWDNNIFVKRQLSDTATVVKRLKKAIAKPFGYASAELHYTRIKRKIIAEKMLDSNDQDFESKSLIDYKILCIHGRPQYVMVIYDRDNDKHTATTELKSVDWQDLRHCLIETVSSKHGYKALRPALLTDMLRYAEILSADFPVVRVDFYQVGGKVYFGELTFTPASGSNDSITEDFLKVLGSRLHLER